MSKGDSKPMVSIRMSVESRELLQIIKERYNVSSYDDAIRMFIGKYDPAALEAAEQIVSIRETAVKDKKQ